MRRKAAERSEKESVIRKLWHKEMACPSYPIPPNKLRKQYQCFTIHPAEPQNYALKSGALVEEDTDLITG